MHPLICVRHHNAYVPRHIIALADSDPSAFFSNKYMLEEGTDIIVSAFGFIGIPAFGDRSLKALLDTCADKVRQVDAIPDKLVDCGGSSFTWSTAKSSIRKLIRSAGVAGFCEFASQYCSPSRTWLSAPSLSPPRQGDSGPPSTRLMKF